MQQRPVDDEVEAHGGGEELQETALDQYEELPDNIEEEDSDADDDGVDIEDVNAEEADADIPDEQIAEEAVNDALRLLEEMEHQNDEQQDLHSAGAELDVANAPAADSQAAILPAGSDVLEWARAPGIAELRFGLGRLGELRYSVTSDFIRAHCARHDSCTRQRSSREHPTSMTNIGRGQGRPLGALYSWLLEAGRYASREEHMAASTASYDNRVAARQEFLELPGAVAFSEDHERAPRPGEGDEPARIR